MFLFIPLPKPFVGAQVTSTMAVVHRAVRGTRLRDWRLQQLPGNEGTLLAVQALAKPSKHMGKHVGKTWKNMEKMVVEN